MEQKEKDKRDFSHILALYLFFTLLIDPDSDGEAIDNLKNLRKYLERGIV